MLTIGFRNLLICLMGLLPSIATAVEAADCTPRNYYPGPDAAFFYSSKPKTYKSGKPGIKYVLCNLDLSGSKLIYNWADAGMQTGLNVGLPLQTCNAKEVSVNNYALGHTDIAFTQAHRVLRTCTVLPKETVGEIISGWIHNKLSIFTSDETNEAFENLAVNFSIHQEGDKTEFYLQWNRSNVLIAMPSDLFDAIGGPELEGIANKANITTDSKPLSEVLHSDEGFSKKELSQNVRAFERNGKSSTALAFSASAGQTVISEQAMYIIDLENGFLIQKAIVYGAKFQ